MTDKGANLRAELTVPPELSDEIAETSLYKCVIDFEPTEDAEHRLLKIYEFLLYGEINGENN
jgi:hypothetical protein